MLQPSIVAASSISSGIPFIKPLKTEKLENMLNDIFGDVLVFSELKKPFVAVCTDLRTGKEIDFDYGNVAKVVSASCAVPGVFSPVVYEKMHSLSLAYTNIYFCNWGIAADCSFWKPRNHHCFREFSNNCP